MIRITLNGAALAAALIFTLQLVDSASAVEFTTSYTDGGNWNSIYGQGFKASMTPSPNPGLTATDTVSLDRFQFFKSGNANVTANFRLAILDNIFVDLDTLTTASPQLMGLSTNSIGGTGAILTGAPISFDFDGVNLIYGDGEDSVDNNYAAIFVTVGTDTGSGAPLTPILVPALIADYAETPPGSGTWLPESDYGDVTANYFLGTTNTISGTAGSGRFFAMFNTYFADANFVATFNMESTELDGDFNGDLVVDAADYTVWRDNLGGLYGPGDYDLWKGNFGATAGGGGIAIAGAAVPEPAAAGLSLIAMIGALAVRSRRRDS
jgi:hypothetical protein